MGRHALGHWLRTSTLWSLPSLGMRGSMASGKPVRSPSRVFIVRSAISMSVQFLMCTGIRTRAGAGNMTLGFLAVKSRDLGFSLAGGGARTTLGLW
jgi:hypothetical protein